MIDLRRKSIPKTGRHCQNNHVQKESSVLQDIVKKCNEVNYVDKETWSGTPISSRR